MQQVTSKRRPKGSLGLQVIQGGANRGQVVSSATAMNRHIKAAVIRLTFDSLLDIRSMEKIARYAGTSECKALDTVREYVYDLRALASDTPPNNGGPMRMRRAA